jgi:hypothetical protein
MKRHSHTAKGRSKDRGCRSETSKINQKLHDWNRANLLRPDFLGLLPWRFDFSNPYAIP